MPIYEFKCNECGTRFDQLCRINWEGSVTCPGCGAVNLTKLISQLAGASRGGGAGCGSCSSKNCGGCK